MHKKIIIINKNKKKVHAKLKINFLIHLKSSRKKIVKSEEI